MDENAIIPRTNAPMVFYTLGYIALIIVGLIYLENILKPLVVAFFTWFIIYRVKVLIQKITINGKHLPSTIGSILALVIIILLLFLLQEILLINIEGLEKQLPGYIATLKETLVDSNSIFVDSKYAEYLQTWFSNLDSTKVIKSILGSFSGVLVNSAIVVVYIIFFLMEDNTIKVKIEKLFSGKEKEYKRYSRNLSRIHKTLRSYFITKTLISFITGVVSYTILIIMKVDYAFLWSFLIFIFNFVPYIGPFISSLLPAIFAMLNKGDLMQFAYVFVVLEAVQIILGNFIEPKIMGKGSNLGPITIIVSLTFWGMIWGVVGILLAIPITSLLLIISSQYRSTRFIAILLSQKGDVDAYRS